MCTNIDLHLDAARNRGVRHRFEQVGLNCFTCVSINGTDKDCDDPVQEAWMNPTQDCKVNSISVKSDSLQNITI